MLFLPCNVEKVLEKLNKSGFSSYVVGGCVRDLLMGREPQDYDIATAASPSQVIDIFEKTVPTGIKHGTVTVIMENKPIEVTTFRTDGDYSDNRRPDNVSFVKDVKTDLSRRDFTVNAIAYNHKEGIVDCFGGNDDIKNNLLRAVGNPEKRFSEDALRILRLFRFASVLGFTPEEKTMQAAIKLSKNLSTVSGERIFAEFGKALCGVNTSALSPLLECNALDFLGINKCFDLSLLLSLPARRNIRFFAFLRLSESNQNEVLQKLKSSNALKEYCSCLKKAFEIPLPESRVDIKCFLRDFGEEPFFDFLTLLRAIYNYDTEKIETQTKDILKKGEPYTLKHLAVDGKTLKTIGINGVKTGIVLKKLLEFVINNPSKNTEGILLKKAIQIK